jgi:hypothetical protein
LEREIDMTSEQEATEALAAMRQARVRANTIRRLPFAYHFGFGAMMAGFIVAVNLPSWAFGFAMAGVILLGTLLYRWQRSATGRWINGYRAGRTLPLAIVTAASLILLLLTSNPDGMPTFNLFTPVQGALLAFAIGTAFDWLWVRIYDREQRDGL